MIPQLSTTDDGLRLAGASAEDLAISYDTPVFALMEERLDDNAAALAEAFDGWELYYAVKANPLTRVLRCVRNGGLGAEVMSGMELAAAAHAGFEGDGMIFNGPAKTDDELTAALDRSVRIHVDNLPEAERLVQLARDRGQTPRVAVRVHPDLPEEVEKEAYVTKASKLGVDPDLGIKVFDTLAGAADPDGLHIHVGTDQTTPMLHRAVAEFAAGYLDRLHDEGFDVRRVNLGGGLATRMDLEAPLEGFAEAMEEPLGDRDVDLELEPGRVLVGDAVACIARVVHVKSTWGKTWVMLDAGANALIPLRYTNFRVVTHRDPPVAPVDVGGPLCLPVDVVETNAEVQPEAGDAVAVLNAGAYTLTMEETFGQPRPAVCAIREGRHGLVRERGRPEDLWERDQEVIW